MEGPATLKERRRTPRFFIELPLEYFVMSAPFSHGGRFVNVSEVGLLINSIS